MCDKFLQGSVETLFRRGGKCLNDFAENLFGKLCTKFYQNRPEFCRRYYKKHFGIFFPGHSVDEVVIIAALPPEVTRPANRSWL